MTHERSRHPRSFTLTELLVVIAIIVLLLGILLVAIGKVQARARRSQTETVLNQFANACAAFQSENGRYPGVLSEALMAANPVNGFPLLTSTENALLDLTGGFRVLAPNDGPAATTEFNAYGGVAHPVGSSGWQIKVDVSRIGEGPLINGKPHAPYFTPGPSDLVKANYPPATDDPAALTLLVPDLIDSWGQPILYLRRLRDQGPLVGDPTPGGGIPAPQFLGAENNNANAIPHAFIRSTALGELAKDQTAGNQGSVLYLSPQVNATLAQVLRHPSIDNQARGAFCLISAGPDGIFFSGIDGPGSNATSVIAITSPPLPANDPNANPKVVDSYDDVRVFGGG